MLKRLVFAVTRKRPRPPQYTPFSPSPLGCIISTFTTKSTSGKNPTAAAAGVGDNDNNDNISNHDNKLKPKESSEIQRKRLLDLLPLHKEEEIMVHVHAPGAPDGSAAPPLSSPLSSSSPLLNPSSDDNNLTSSSASSEENDFPAPKPLTDWQSLDIFDFKRKRPDHEEMDPVQARAKFEQLQREDSRSVGMDADDIAAYEAIERKEKEALESAMLLQQPELSYNAVTRALIGNTVITVLKFGVYLKTGSAAMLSEAVHTLVDSGNQAILLVGIRQLSNPSDKRHPYGYGRAAYFWGLVSALGMFWVGSGISLIHGVNELLHPPSVIVEPGWETWSTLGISFGIDGYVLYKTINDMKRSLPSGMSFYDFTTKIRDPFVMAVLLEDMAATTGVLIAVGGIGLTYWTGSPMFDALASCGVGITLGAVAIYLARMNQRFLLGQAIDTEIVSGIRRIILARPSIQAVHSIQTQWLGPSAFSFKAEVDFDGTYPAANLMTGYAPMFQDMQIRNTMEEDLPVVLGWYAEDVTRILETEVKEVEKEIRAAFPDAAYIELEPDSKDHRIRLTSGNTRGGKDWERERQDIARMAEMVSLSRLLEGATARKPGSGSSGDGSDNKVN